MASEGRPGQVTLPEAASMLRMPEVGVEALVGAGYLRADTEAPGGPRFNLGDLKGFLARVDEDREEGIDLTGGADVLDDLDPQDLLDALDVRSEDMARRSLDLLTAVFPDAARWPLAQQAHFIAEARARFEAIVAVASLGSHVDNELIDELGLVGADAARDGTPLTELLLVLRISRDLVVQTAVEVAEERGRRWGLALSLVLTRVLPALDRLTDAIARGYWLATMTRQEGDQARYANVVEGSSDGVYEVDGDGRILYANAALGLLLGRNATELVGLQLGQALDAATEVDFAAPHNEVAVRRADGVVRIVDIRTLERREGDGIVGYDGVVRDMTAALQAEQLRNDFLALLGQELRQPLTVVLGLGATLATYGDELGTDRVAAVGERIRHQAERMSRLADDLYEVSRVELGSLVLSPRQVDLAPIVEAAIASVAGDGEAIEPPIAVAVPPGVRVVADPRRLELVVANLVENALRFGAPPVEVDARSTADGVTLVVRDHGEGVDPDIVPTLFSELRPLTGRPRRSAGVGLGLALVRGLVEAMGGRVRYEAASAGGAAFTVTLPRG